MTTVLVLLLVAASSLGLTAEPAGRSGAQQPKIDEFKMTTYQAVVVTKGPKWSADSPLVRAHREYIAELLRSGRAHIAGPFAGDSHLRGAYIVSATPEAAKATGEADPAVKAGHYDIELLTWMGPEGWFQKPANVDDTETIFFGFLVTGSNSAAIAPEETKTLMGAHLDYLDGQAKLGKLVLAGPLAKAAPRRGLIAYRVPTMGEALERASADPMVKAGRMKPELYAWTIPKGILK